LPACLLVADLLRDDVPDLNYVIASAFVGMVLTGVALIALPGPVILATSPFPDR
jgi:hypothetical protein